MKEKLNEINTKGTKPNPSLVKKYKEQFLSSINDDLNMPEALAVLWGVLKEDNLSSKDILSLVKDVDTIFALDLLKKEKLSIPKEIQDLANLRLKYRKEKNFQKADEVRKHIESKGYIVEDQESGFRLKKQ
jgi:cysteinyl-tRNA synthetase